MKHILFLCPVFLFFAGCTGQSPPISAYVPPLPVPSPTQPKLFVPPAPNGFKLTGQFVVPRYGDRCMLPVFSPDGKWLAAPGSSSVFLWKVHHQQLNRRLQLPPEPSPIFNKVLWSPNGKQIAAWGSQGPYGILAVWDCLSGALRFSMNAKSQIVYSACYTNDGRLLIAWADINAATLFTQPGHLSRVSQGRIQQDVAFKDCLIVQLAARKKKPSLALVWKLVDGQGNTENPAYKSSVCEWVNDHLSKPLVQFEAGIDPFSMELSHDEKRLVFGGIQRVHPAFLYLGFDLTTNKITWRTQMRRVTPAFQLSISADDRWVYDPTSLGGSRYLTFDVRNGDLASKAPPPTSYSNDGRFTVRLLDLRDLSSYDLDRVRTHDPKFGPAPFIPVAYLYRKQRPQRRNR